MSSSMDVGDGPPGRIAGPPLVPRRTSRSGEVIKTAAPWAVVLVDAIHTIETVGAEEIALRLDEVRRAAGAAIGVEIGERRRKRRNRQTREGCIGHHPPRSEEHTSELQSLMRI